MKAELSTAMKDWQLKPVGDVFDINPETLPNSTPSGYYFKYITLESVNPERIDFAAVQKIRFGEAPSRARRVIKRGDLLVSTVRPNLQGFAEFQPLEDGPYVCSTGFVVLRPKGGHDPQFYLQQLLSDFGSRQFHAYVTGTNYPAISDRDFTRLKLYVPKDDIEKEATVVLRNISTAMIAARESIAKAERLQKGLMQQLLTGRLKPDGKTRPQNEFKPDKEFGRIPRSWRSCKFKDLLREGAILGIQDGNHGEKHPTQDDYVAEGIPFVMANDISAGRLDLENTKKISRELADNLRIGFSIRDDVLLSHKASIGFTAIVGDVSPYIMLTPQVTYYRCNKELLLPQFLHYYFRSFRFQRILDALSAQSTRNYIGITSQKKLPICYPPDIEEQNAISEALSGVDSLLQAKRKKIEALKRLKKSLMQNLLVGRIRLPMNSSVAK